eukprot:Sspe_Gene.27939::Locus_12379_Transcript_2_2_Confidence_0.750_Length_1448::g.27939::m.27939
MDWDEADRHTKRADLCIVMGTSMSLRHITHFPFQAKQAVIVNLQETPDDARCDLRIWATCDEVMQGLMQRLSIDLEPVPAWRPRDALPISKVPSSGKDTAKYLEERATRLEKEAASLAPPRRSG